MLLRAFLSAHDLRRGGRFLGGRLQIGGGLSGLSHGVSEVAKGLRRRVFARVPCELAEPACLDGELMPSFRCKGALRGTGFVDPMGEWLWRGQGPNGTGHG